MESKQARWIEHPYGGDWWISCASKWWIVQCTFQFNGGKATTFVVYHHNRRIQQGISMFPPSRILCQCLKWCNQRWCIVFNDLHPWCRGWLDGWKGLGQGQSKFWCFSLPAQITTSIDRGKRICRQRSRIQNKIVKCLDRHRNDMDFRWNMARMFRWWWFEWWILLWWIRFGQHRGFLCINTIFPGNACDSDMVFFTRRCCAQKKWCGGQFDPRMDCRWAYHNHRRQCDGLFIH